MKIAIYHNLKNGGALVQMKQWTHQLRQRGHTLNIFSKKTPKFSKNILLNLIQVICYSIHSDYLLAKKINQQNFDKILVFPCHLTQSPFILLFLKKKKNVVYIFAERNREFYENTSFLYNTIKKILAKFIRLPLKIIDQLNCRIAVNIVTNSYYSNFILQKTYNRVGTVIYPCLKFNIKSKAAPTSHGKFALTIGNLVKTKGYDFSIKLLHSTNTSFVTVGNYCDNKEKEYLKKLIVNNKINIVILRKISEKNKNTLFKKAKYYLSNQTGEPFGISTVEASNNRVPVFGVNSGGTPEIIQTGINGFLYPENLLLARKIIGFTNYKFRYQIKLDWKQSAGKLIKYIETTHD